MDPAQSQCFSQVGLLDPFVARHLGRCADGEQLSVVQDRDAVGEAGNVYIADSQNNRVRKVDTKGIITTFAGNGSLPSPRLLGRFRARHRRQPANLPSAMAVDSYG